MATSTDDVTDLASYKPSSADDLLQGLLSTAATAAGASWNDLREDITGHLTSIAQNTLQTKTDLLANKITEKQADATFSLLELDLNNSLLEAEIVPYIVGQKVLDAVVAVAIAVIKNYTGIALNF